MPAKILALSLNSTRPGNIFLEGDITHHTVLSILDIDVFASATQVVVDFSAVIRADSSGLALMTHWLRQARNRNKEIKYVNVPETLLAIAKMSGLDSVISISAKGL